MVFCLIPHTPEFFQKTLAKISIVYFFRRSACEPCGILDVGKNTVYDLLKTRKIKNFRIGKRYRVTRDAVIDYILYSQQ